MNVECNRQVYVRFAFNSYSEKTCIGLVDSGSVSPGDGVTKLDQLDTHGAGVQEIDQRNLVVRGRKAARADAVGNRVDRERAVVEDRR